MHFVHYIDHSELVDTQGSVLQEQIANATCAHRQERLGSGRVTVCTEHEIEDLEIFAFSLIWTCFSGSIFAFIARPGRDRRSL